jgi:hypothetical protein
MDPEGFLQDEVGQASHPLRELPSKPFLKQASHEEVGRGNNEKKSNKDIVKQMDHPETLGEIGRWGDSKPALYLFHPFTLSPHPSFLK